MNRKRGQQCVRWGRQKGEIVLEAEMTITFVAPTIIFVVENNEQYYRLGRPSTNLKKAKGWPAKGLPNDSTIKRAVNK